jgi:gliding motility-associated lipoprotein GldH
VTLTIIKKTNKIFVLLFVAFIVFACNNNDVYHSYQSVSPQGWSKDSSYTFDVAIDDVAASYNIYVNVRNVGDYPYQNLWLFLSKTTPTKVQQNDTIECYLADQRGKWLGTGIGSTYHMSVLYLQNTHFDTKGTYRYKIAHGMRDDLLVGVNDIGVRVEKVINK